MTQLNTPHPSTAYITGFLRSRGTNAVQADLALALPEVYIACSRSSDSLSVAFRNR